MDRPVISHTRLAHTWLFCQHRRHEIVQDSSQLWVLAHIVSVGRLEFRLAHAHTKWACI
jgi:hypothetical protein